jgi:ribosomal protein L23
MKVVREELRKPFYYRNVSESTIHDYDYFFFNFSDITHVRKLLKQYYKLKNSSVEDVRILVDEFDDYIEVADLTEIEKEIIFYFRTDSTVSEIVKRVAFEYQIDEKKVRRMINNTIPKKIANTYKVLKDEYIMDKYKIKGKKCSKCGLIKLACKRNFGRHPKTTDGYQSICKQCDNLRK